MFNRVIACAAILCVVGDPSVKLAGAAKLPATPPRSAFARFGQEAMAVRACPFRLSQQLNRTSDLLLLNLFFAGTLCASGYSTKSDISHAPTLEDLADRIRMALQVEKAEALQNLRSRGKSKNSRKYGRTKESYKKSLNALNQLVDAGEDQVLRLLHRFRRFGVATSLRRLREDLQEKKWGTANEIFWTHELERSGHQIIGRNVSLEVPRRKDRKPAQIEWDAVSLTERKRDDGQVLRTVHIVEIKTKLKSVGYSGHRFKTIQEAFASPSTRPAMDRQLRDQLALEPAQVHELGDLLAQTEELTALDSYIDGVRRRRYTRTNGRMRIVFETMRGVHPRLSPAPTVRLRLSGALGVQIGKAKIISQGVTIAETLERERLRTVLANPQTYRIFLNGERAAPESLLKDGDEIMILPPIGGGSVDLQQPVRPTDFFPGLKIAYRNPAAQNHGVGIVDDVDEKDISILFPNAKGHNGPLRVRMPLLMAYSRFIIAESADIPSAAKPTAEPINRRAQRTIPEDQAFVQVDPFPALVDAPEINVERIRPGRMKILLDQFTYAETDEPAHVQSIIQRASWQYAQWKDPSLIESYLRRNDIYYRVLAPQKAMVEVGDKIILLRKAPSQSPPKLTGNLLRRSA